MKDTLIEETVSPDGQTIIQHITREPLSVRAADAATMLKLASNIQRLEFGLATSIVKTVDPHEQTCKRLNAFNVSIKELIQEEWQTSLGDGLTK